MDESLDSYFYSYFYGRKRVENDDYIENHMPTSVKRVKFSTDVQSIKSPIIEDVYEDDAVVNGVMDPKTVCAFPKEPEDIEEPIEEMEIEHEKDSQEREKREERDKDPQEREREKREIREKKPTKMRAKRRKRNLKA